MSALGQDQPASLNPPDFILRVKQGDNYGFPKCNWTKGSPCKGYTKPFKMFAPHTDIMGMAIVGKRLYMTSFTGLTGKAGEVFSMPLKGGKLKPFVTGFVAPTVGLGGNGRSLYDRRADRPGVQGHALASGWWWRATRRATTRASTVVAHGPQPARYRSGVDVTGAHYHWRPRSRPRS